MATKQQIQTIKENNERTIQGLRTGFKEFTYEETGGYVKPDKLYSIYYTLTKKQVYITGTQGTYNSKTINKVIDDGLFASYSRIVSEQIIHKVHLQHQQIQIMKLAVLHDILHK